MAAPLRGRARRAPASAGKIPLKPGAASRHSWGPASLETLAGTLGLDRERFQRALDSSTWNHSVDLDAVEGQRRQITATPTFFINGKALLGAQPLERFAQAIDAEL